MKDATSRRMAKFDWGKKDDYWKIIDQFLTVNGPSQLQIDSYNDFISKLPKLINEQGKIKTFINHQFSSGNKNPRNIVWEVEFDCLSL